MTEKNLADEITPKKTIFSYDDLIRMKSDTIYNSLGKIIDPRLPQAPRATFGK